MLVTNTGLTFESEVPIATLTPRPGLREFAGYGLLGIYVGVIPVGLGLLWYPAMKRMGRKWLGFILALTVGLLVFLLVDTFLEVLETGAKLPGAFQGVPLALFAALLTWLAITAVSAMQNRRSEASGSVRATGMFLATLIALSIGLHNFGEGLAVGAAFALGEAALGSFLVIGFILHNITEGIGIAAPLVSNRRGEGEPAAGSPHFAYFCRVGAPGRVPRRTRHLDRRVCVLAFVGDPFPGDWTGRYLAGDRGGHGSPAPLCGAGEYPVDLLAQPERVPDRPGDYVLYRFSGEVLKDHSSGLDIEKSWQFMAVSFFGGEGRLRPRSVKTKPAG